MYDKEVGYCQGSLFIAGMLLMHVSASNYVQYVAVVLLLCTPADARGRCVWCVCQFDVSLQAERTLQTING